MAAALATIGTGCSRPAEPSSPPAADVGVVERVVDGDTIELRIGDNVESVRLIGLDAPESVARTVPDQCYGAEAAAALTELLPAGTEVGVRRDVEGRDHYGRLLLYVHRMSDELFINRWLVDNGYADAISYEPNTAFASEFDLLARSARSSGRGLWGACDGPDQPLDP